ncbi:response regulator [Bernardetia sp.]|uniref:response regulator n=1 Tax=Bernardetia sp. TaxID=1937974 RepID=UPI0025BC8989|nr:response regulator [Bernardetia sp.]
MGSKKILIAEDSSVIQNITRKVLQFQNYEIETAKDGLQVLEAMAMDDFDAILMDINMPKMDGMECAKKVREMSDPKKSQIPIIAITGNARNYTAKDFKAVGINDFMQKPVNFDDLVEKLSSYLDK